MPFERVPLESVLLQPGVLGANSKTDFQAEARVGFRDADLSRSSDRVPESKVRML